MPKFAERLKSLRLSNNLSQADLGKQIQVSKSSINMYERGEREPGLETLERIADYFNVDMDYLLGKSDAVRKERLDFLTISEPSKHTVSKEDIIFALFRGKENITDEMFEEVQNFADFVAQREAAKKNKK